MNRIVKRMAVPVGAAIILGSSGFAFMATNTVSPSNAGSGDGAISGYTVYDVHYHNVDNPEYVPGGTYVQTVSFKLSPDNATQARAWITDVNDKGIGQYFNCSELGGTWTCQNSGAGWLGSVWAPTIQAQHLHVSAAQ